MHIMKSGFCSKTAGIGVALAIAFVCVAGLPLRADPKKRECYHDWSSAQVAVQRHHLSRVEQLSRAAQRLGLGKVVKATLCREGGHFEYRVIVRDRHGRLRRRVTEARAPFASKREALKKKHRKRRPSRRRR